MTTQTQEHRSKTTKAERPVTRAEYNALLDRLEDLEDALTLLHAEDDAPDGDAWPDTLVERMLAGEHPLRLWREQRGLTLDGLSRAAGVAAGYLSEIESGKKPGSTASLKKCAIALRVSMDDLVGMTRLQTLVDEADDKAKGKKAKREQ